MNLKIELPNGVVIEIDGSKVKVTHDNTEYFAADDSGPITKPPNPPGHH